MKLKTKKIKNEREYHPNKKNPLFYLFSLTLIIIILTIPQALADQSNTGLIGTNTGADNTRYGAKITFTDWNTNKTLIGISFYATISPINCTITNRTGYTINSSTNINGNFCFLGANINQTYDAIQGYYIFMKGNNINYTNGASNQNITNNTVNYQFRFFLNSTDAVVPDAANSIINLNGINWTNITSTPPATGYTITLNSPANATTQYWTNNNITINTTSSGFGSNVTTNHYLLNSTFAIIQSRLGTNQSNMSSNFTNLTIGTYYLNASAANNTNNNITGLVTIYIYNATQPTITFPAQNSILSSRLINFTWINITFTPSAANVGLSSINLSLMNSTGGLNYTIINGATNNNYSLDIYSRNNSAPLIFGINISMTDTLGNSFSTINQFNQTTNALLNITFRDGVNFTQAAYDNLNITFSNQWLTIITNTTTGNVSIDIIKNLNNTINIVSNLYVPKTTTYFSNNNTPQFTNITLFLQRSVFVNFFDETTGFLITQPIALTVSGVTQTNYSTITGRIYVTNLTNVNTEFKANSPNYTETRNYVNVNNDFNNISLFLQPINNTQNLTLTFQSQDGVARGGVDVTQNILTANGYVEVGEVFSDVNGVARFTFLTNFYYCYNYSLSPYLPGSLCLNPPQSQNYLINLLQNSGSQFYHPPNATMWDSFNQSNFILTTYFAYGDPLGLDTISYNVDAQINNQTITVCTSSSTSNNGTFTCNLLNYNGTVHVVGKFNSNIFFGDYITINQPANLSSLFDVNDSLLIAFFLVITSILVGVNFGPIGSIIGSIIGLFLVFQLGLANFITISTLMGILVVSIVLMAKIQR